MKQLILSAAIITLVFAQRAEAQFDEAHAFIDTGVSWLVPTMTNHRSKVANTDSVNKQKVRTVELLANLTPQQVASLHQRNMRLKLQVKQHQEAELRRRKLRRRRWTIVVVVGLALGIMGGVALASIQLPKGGKEKLGLLLLLGL